MIKNKKMSKVKKPSGEVFVKVDRYLRFGKDVVAVVNKLDTRLASVEKLLGGGDVAGLANRVEAVEARVTQFRHAVERISIETRGCRTCWYYGVDPATRPPCKKCDSAYSKWKAVVAPEPLSSWDDVVAAITRVAVDESVPVVERQRRFVELRADVDTMLMKLLSRSK